MLTTNDQSEIDLLLDHDWGGIELVQYLHNITQEDFNNLFLGENSHRFIKMIKKNDYKSIFNAAARLNLLEKSLKMLVKDDEFEGNLLSYIKYKIDQEPKYFDKYSLIIAYIQELKHNEHKVDDHNTYDLEDSLSEYSTIYSSEKVINQSNKYFFKSKEVKEIYDNLKNAIDNCDSVKDIIKNNEPCNIQEALCANSKGVDSLIIDALKKNVEVPKEIYSYDEKLSSYTIAPDFLIEKEIYYSAIKGDIDIIKNAKDFIDQSPKSRSYIFYRLREEFTRAIKRNDIPLASKMYRTCKSAGITAFKQKKGGIYLFHGTHLPDAVSYIKKGDDSFLRNTLNFAKENNLLTDVFQRDCYCGKNLLQHAQKEGVKTEVEKIIKEYGVDSVEYLPPDKDLFFR